jgi:4-amino-4-deoxy-L-arabinose transferase-like glycosyltransferase
MSPGMKVRFALALYAFGILSIGLTRDWELRHEDNGAMHTTLALSHLRLGLAQTRAHDMYYNPHTGAAVPYGHHPPAIALLLAGTFALTGSDSPAVARMTVIVFHIGSVLLLTTLLAQFFETRLALAGGFVMATLPMSGFYGRLVNYEPLCLLAVLVQLYGYVRFKLTGRRRALMWLSLGIVAGALIDWASFFFTATLALVETIDMARRRSRGFGLLAVLVASPAFMVVIDLWHLWYASRDSLQALVSVVSSNRPIWEQDFTIGRFVLGQIDTFRRFFTEIGLIAVLLVAVCLVRPRSQLSRRLFDVSHADMLVRVLLVGGLASLGYVLAAPSWAMAHQYWQFYFLPVVVISIVLLWRLLQHAIAERSTPLLRALRVVVVLDVFIASAYWLHFRHTRVEEYAVQTTATFRSTFLAPESLQGPDETPK